MSTPKKAAAPKKTAAPAQATPKATAKKAAPAAKATAKKAAAPAAKKAAPAAKRSTTAAKRADFGAPIDDVFKSLSPAIAPVMNKLREVVEKTVPDAESGLKWGKPCYMIKGNIVCMVANHKAHVNLIFSGPEGTFDDPEGLLQGDGKTGRHLKLTEVKDIPERHVVRWLEASAKLARAKS